MKKKKDTNVATGYSTYAEQVLPAEAGDAQKQETKRAFFAGAWFMFNHTADLAVKDEDNCLEVMNSMFREMKTFAKDVKKGKE